MTWNPDQYHLFREARSAPVRDLHALIPDQTYASVIDLGCGTGEHTLTLARRFPQAQVTGLDQSAEMLERAQAQQAPNLHFTQGDLGRLDGTYDLIHANASLQWVPDHPALLAHLWAHLSPGGVLAAQVPANHDHPSHRLLTDTALDFQDELGGYARFGTAHGASPVLTPARYAELLDALGGTDITALSRVYPAVLNGADGLLDWTKGTALVPYLSRLTQDGQQRFLAAYRERLHAAYPGARVYYAFTRTLFTARRPA